MTGDVLQNDDHVVRYVRPMLISDDGAVDGSAFRLRSGESGLSVNWLDCFRELSKREQLEQIRRLTRINMRRNGRLAELNVGETLGRVGSRLSALRFVHRPLLADGGYPADPSHSAIEGLPSGASPEAALIGDLIASSVQQTHPAVL